MKNQIWEETRNNRILHRLNCEYRQLISFICKDAMRTFRGIPITWEDVYFEFLNEAIQLVKTFDVNAGVPFKTFIGMKCKFFVKNKCRKYTTRKHAIMNNRIDFDKICMMKPTDEHLSFCDEQEIKEIDLRLLNNREMMVYQLFAVDGNSIKKTSELMNISTYRVRKKIETIVAKTQLKIKN